MVVDDLDIVRIAIVPYEAETPLVVDPYAVLASSIALERFEAIPGRHFQIIQSASDLELSQFAPRDRSDVHESPDVIALG